jgi:hypothetical protein
MINILKNLGIGNMDITDTDDDDDECNNEMSDVSYMSDTISRLLFLIQYIL